MKKILLTLLLITVITNNSLPALAKKAKKVDKAQAQNEQVFSQDEQQVDVFLTKYLNCSNEHNLDCLKSLYSDDFISSDNFNKETFLKMTSDTWKNFPNLKINSKLKSVRISDDYATLQTVDEISATSNNKSDMVNDTGELKSISETAIYLRKYGKTWKIYSESTLFEKTILKYGSGKKIQANIFAPEQVKAGESYTTTLKAAIPQGTLAVGSITKEPIVYPQAKSEEVFRQISPEEGILERILKANITNNNELTIGSIGITQVVNNFNAKPTAELTGLIVVIQRVNVIPKSTYENTKQN